MALSVPKSPKTKTKIYENFKGIDYTNDSTNVWYRRSPSGVNMLPDASGRPFKRTGWEIAKDKNGNEISADYLCTLLGVEETRITKCFYFELAGCDHIIIFCEGGIFRLVKETETVNGVEQTVNSLYSMDTELGSTESKDQDCYNSWDRAFFFEGGGKSAFYIYGNYKVWIYEYIDGRFKFSRSSYKYPNDTDGIDIPIVLIGANADGSGTTLDGYNLVGNLASVEYQGNLLWYYYCSSSISISIVKATFQTAYPVATPPTYYTFEYDGTVWKNGATTVDLATLGITILTGTPQNGDKIVVLNDVYGVVLPNNVSQDQVDECRAYRVTTTQWDTPLDVDLEGTTITTNNCVLHTDTVSANKQAWVQFYADYSTTDQEDKIKIIFPVTEITITNYVDEVAGGTATVNL